MPKFLNNLLCSLMIFALSFLWIYFCLKSVAWAVSLGLILALCSAYLIYRIQNKVGQVKAVKQQNKKAAAKLCDYLKFNDDNASLFADLYGYYHYTTFYRKDSVSSFDIAEAVVKAKRKKTNKLLIYAAKIDANALKSATQYFDVKFADVNNAYELLASADKLPVLPNTKPTKNSFVAKYAFCRKRFGWYFASSVFMALLSLIAYFPYYLLGWSTVMLILALYSMFNTRYNVKQTNLKI